MSLIGFHKFLISTGILFCVGFGSWLVTGYARGGGLAELVLAGAFGISALVLGVYLAFLDRILGRRDR